MAKHFKSLLVLSASVLLLATACKKDVGVNNGKVVPGQIQFSIIDNITLKQTMTAVRGIGANEYDLQNFLYTKKFQPDSSSYYFKIFKSCSYITAFDMWNVKDYTMFRNLHFKNLDEATYNKWDSIATSERFTEALNSGGAYQRTGMLYVPAGDEKLWIDRLKSLPEISSAGYLYYGNFD